jgi:Fur family transcriptional regulator, ferric uptake regulator
MGTGSAVYEAVTEAIHHHLVCERCSSVFTLSHADVARFYADLQQKSKYQITTNHLVLFGICAKCQRTTPKTDQEA